MSVKVRCKGCQKVLKAPDKARGKSLKCPQCGERVRVPTGKSRSSSTSSSARKKRPKVKEEDTDGLGFLTGIDLSDTRRIEHKSIRICPKCAVEVDEEDEICENCGVIIETGQLSEKEKRKRERRGPDPADFYPLAWSDPWKFTLGHLPVILRTIIFWTFFGTLFICCSILSGWCENIPPKLFWAGLAFVSMLGMYGWFFFLQMEVMKLTFAKKKVLKKIKFDPFSAMSLGLKLFIWPVVLVLPFIWFPPIWVLPMLVFPIAMTHFSMPYTYQAFLPINMIKQFFNTAGASLYYLMIVFVISLVNIVLLVVFSIFAVPITTWIITMIGSIALSMVAYDPNQPSMTGYVVIGMVGLFILGFVCFLISLFAAPVAVYIMRLTGLFGYYNQEKLELMRYQPTNGKAPFGARYMAFLVDRFIAGTYFAVVFGLLAGAAWIIMFMAGSLPEGDSSTLEAADRIRAFVWLFRFPVAITMMGKAGFIYKYYIGSVTSPSQATLGKHALGLIVVDHKGRRLKKKLAWKRFSTRSMTGTFTLGISFLMAAFNEDQQTMHDRMTKTQVLWKGDDERN